MLAAIFDLSTEWFNERGVVLAFFYDVYIYGDCLFLLTLLLRKLSLPRLKLPFLNFAPEKCDYTNSDYFGFFEARINSSLSIKGLAL